MHPSQYRKALTAVLGVALLYLSHYYGTNEYVILAISLATALGVYHVPNATSKPDPNSAEALRPLIETIVNSQAPMTKPPEVVS